VPAYEGSLLYDSFSPKPNEAPCVWGTVEGLRKQALYGALRMPTPLVPKPMLRAGPIEVYSPFVSFLTKQSSSGHFQPFVEGRDFFIFAYDWRQDISKVLAPLLGQKLREYEKIYAEHASEHDPKPEIIIVAHSMGGLISRTLLQQEPEWRERVARLFILGTPNRGCVKAVKTLAVGPGGLRENDLRFPVSLLRLLPSDINLLLTKMVAISRSSIYQLLPFDDPSWVTNLPDKARFNAEDLLEVSTWRNFWPSAQAERELYLQPWLDKQEEVGRPIQDRSEYEFCQDPELPKLTKILQGVKTWKKELGPLSTTHQSLMRSGEPSRLWTVIGTGFPTPRGYRGCDGKGVNVDPGEFYDDVEGDLTVTKQSALDDLPLDEANILTLPKVNHGGIVNHPLFWDKLAHFLRD
jgi:pimeloyl-ACP methyl ester carboxylesterase